MAVNDVRVVWIEETQKAAGHFERKEHLPSYSAPVAKWDGTRYFAVDYDGGSDANLGYSDVSLADAGTKAVKTLEHLRMIFPKFGYARKAVVAIRSRAGGATYRNIADTADDDIDFLQGVYGYEHLLVRGTDTIASAGSVAFANDLNDKIAAGARLVPGTSAAGYNPAGVITASDFDVLPATLPAEPAVIGKRIRFDAATPTVALRNATSMIWLNTASHIMLGVNLPAVPTAADTFYIEEPGVAVGRVLMKSSNPNSVAVPPSFAVQGVTVAGVRTVAAATAIVVRGAAGFLSLAFCETPAAATISVSVSNVGDFRLQPSYTDEATTPATITVGASLRTDGLAVSGATNFSASSFACITFRPQVLNVTQFSVGSGSYSFAGILVQGSGLAAAPATAVGGTSVGSLGSATSRRMRSLSPFSGTEIAVIFSNVLIHGVDLTGAGASALISVNGVGCSVAIHDAVGSAGNTGSGLSLLSARDCSVLMGTLGANTFTGAVGQDIQGAGPVFYIHADYARTDLRDNQGNHVQGTAGSIMGPTTLATNDGTADIGQYKVVRATGSGTVRAAQADTFANASGVVGVTQSPATAAGPQSAMLTNGGATWIQFDAAPTVGNIAYLSTATPGNAQDTVPAVAGTNQSLKLGRVLRVSGTLGLVMWTPDSVPVFADGGAATALFSWKADAATNPSRVSEDQVWAFELTDGTTKGVVITLFTPAGMSFATNPIVNIPFIVTVPGAASANVRMRLTCRYIANGELTSKAPDETLFQTVAVVNTDKRMDVMSFTLDAALLAPGDKINLHLERLGADGLDTFTGSIGILEDSSRFDYAQ